MLDIQLGRRNLSPIQRIAIAEKYRPIYEKQARENLKQVSGGDRRSEDFKKIKVCRILQGLKIKLMYVPKAGVGVGTVARYDDLLKYH